MSSFHLLFAHTSFWLGSLCIWFIVVTFSYKFRDIFLHFFFFHLFYVIRLFVCMSVRFPSFVCYCFGSFIYETVNCFTEPIYDIFKRHGKVRFRATKYTTVYDLPSRLYKNVIYTINFKKITSSITIL